MIRLMTRLLLAVACFPASAALQVFATVPEWGALVREIGGDKVNVFVATTALQDPHRIEARPSLLAQARRTRLVVATGADLEAGWLPLVARDSGNAGIQRGQPGYFEAAGYVTLLDVPPALDRTQGAPKLPRCNNETCPWYCSEKICRALPSIRVSTAVDWPLSFSAYSITRISASWVPRLAEW